MANGTLKLWYIIASPRIVLYMEYSTMIYEIYKSLVAPEDIHVYSIGEAFIDATWYLKSYGLTARDFVSKN